MTVLHYHGTPITPREELLRLRGRMFCVSHAEPRDLETCLSIGQSVMMDNGAFSAWRRGVAPDWPAFYRWVEPHLRHPHWAVVPDVIAGGEEENDALLREWPHPREFSAPVWHLHESLERLTRLACEWPRIALGSSGEFAAIGTGAWRRRIDEAWAAIEATGARPWVHMLRAMDAVSRGGWPFASADSTNLARNHAGNAGRASCDVVALADRIEARNPRFIGKRAAQGTLFA